jgi:hypothetical protein
MKSCLISRQVAAGARLLRNSQAGHTTRSTGTATSLSRSLRFNIDVAPLTLAKTPRASVVQPERPISTIIRARIDLTGFRVKTPVLHYRRYATTTIPPSLLDGPKSKTTPKALRTPSRRRILYYLLGFLLFSTVCYQTIPPARHLLIASIRCARLVKAVILNVLDYKYTFLDWYPEDKYSKEERKQLARRDRHACHARSSERLFQALKSNAGIYVKLGQHIASIQALPKE